MTLENQLTALLTVEKAKNEARERWLALLAESDAGQAEARRTHLALDGEYEARLAALTKALGELRATGMLDLALLTLDSELSRALSHLASERDFRELLEPVKITDLGELVAAWRAANATLTAAQRLSNVRLACDDAAAFDVAVAEESTRYADEEALSRAVAVYKALLAGIALSEGDEYERMSTACHATIRRARKQADELTEQLQSFLESLNDRGMLDYALSELDPAVRRAVYAAIDGGLIRQREVAQKPLARQREVAVIDEEAVDSDTETSAEAKAAVDELLRSLGWQ